MGEWDVYCAFCSGPLLKSRIKFTRKKAASKSKEDRVDQELQTPFEPHVNTDEEKDIENSEDEDERSDDEDKQLLNYDSDILLQQDVEWVGRCRCLALNMQWFEMHGAGKAFISGLGHPNGLGHLCVNRRGEGDIDPRWFREMI